MHKIITCDSDFRPYSSSLWYSDLMLLAVWYKERRELSAQTSSGGPANPQCSVLDPIQLQEASTKYRHIS